MYDLIVIGSGVAGLSAALAASHRGRVAVVTKDSLDDGCTRYAQGGIAAALGDGDSAQQHFEDTMAAGRGLCDPAAVRILVEEGPARVRELGAFGVVFDSEDGRLALGREAAHSQARIVHAGGDATGLAVETSLAQRVRRSRVRCIEHADVQRLLLDTRGHCCGVVLSTGAVRNVVLRSAAVVLASGGASRLWRESTNPASATGDGVALAYDAGADIAAMEFEQFHPTALAIPGVQRHLISEAVRGEGAFVVDEHGDRFLLATDPRGELAGRDIVARAIVTHLERTGAANVFLDCRPIADRFAQRFPSIHRMCVEQGIDVRHDRIPVAPAAHYTIGGVWTDVRGATSVTGLYACGEVASTGVHGANRLASNSLLESLVFGHRAGVSALADTAELPPGRPVDVAGPAESDADDASTLRRVQTAMSQHAGVVRDAAGLQEALAVCNEILDASARSPAASHRRAARTAALLCSSALRREESRGAHFRSDFPEPAAGWHGVTVMQHQRREEGVRNT